MPNTSITQGYGIFTTKISVGFSRQISYRPTEHHGASLGVCERVRNGLRMLLRLVSEVFRVLPEVFREYGLFSVKNAVQMLFFFKCAKLSWAHVLDKKQPPKQRGCLCVKSVFLIGAKPTALDSGALIETFTRFCPEKSGWQYVSVSTRTSKARLLAIFCCCRRHATAPTHHISSPS